MSWNRLVRDSDVISVHVPHTPQTDGMLDMDVFGKMKSSAFLVNTSRGRVVNQRDLVAALKKKMIAGAGLDVFESEPLRGGALTRLDNVVMAPHIGSSTAETRIRMAEIAVENLHRGISGKRPVYSVGY